MLPTAGIWSKWPKQALAPMVSLVIAESRGLNNTHVLAPYASNCRDMEQVAQAFHADTSLPSRTAAALYDTLKSRYVNLWCLLAWGRKACTSIPLVHVGMRKKSLVQRFFIAVSMCFIGKDLWSFGISTVFPVLILLASQSEPSGLKTAACTCSLHVIH
jgi:hypothetical protein